MELKPRRKRHDGLQPGHVRRSRRRVLRPRIGGIRRGVEPQIRPTTDPLKVGRDHNTRKMGVAHHRSRGPSWDYSGGCRSASGMIDTRVSESAWHWHPGASVPGRLQEPINQLNSYSAARRPKTWFSDVSPPIDKPRLPILPSLRFRTRTCESQSGGDLRNTQPAA